MRFSRLGMMSAENVFAKEAAYERVSECGFGVGVRVLFLNLVTQCSPRIGQPNGWLSR